jgi:hypothetical protein
MMNILLVKMILMPLVIGGVTLASKRWGNAIGGIIASFPWVAGPILLFFTIEQGIPFTVNTIKGVMIGIIGVVVFCYAYIFAAYKLKWYWCLAIAYLSFLLSSIFLNKIGTQISLNLWFILAVIISLASIYAFPKIKQEASHYKILKNEIYLRMVVITVFVILITYLAKILGPTWSGILTPFPIITAILAAFTHYTQGHFGTSVVLKGMMSGFIGFATFLFLQAIFLPIYSIPISFGIGFVANLIVNLCMQYLVRKLT